MKPRRELRRALAEVFQREVSAETEADQIDGLRRVVRQRVGDDSVQIPGRAAVIHPQQAVRLAAADAEIPHQHVPATPDQGGGHALDVAGFQAGFQAVGKNREARATLRRPFQVEEIAVRKLQPIGPFGGARHPPEQGGVDGLHVPAGQPRWRAVAGILNQWHECLPVI